MICTSAVGSYFYALLPFSGDIDATLCNSYKQNTVFENLKNNLNMLLMVIVRRKKIKVARTAQVKIHQAASLGLTDVRGTEASRSEQSNSCCI